MFVSTTRTAVLLRYMLAIAAFLLIGALALDRTRYAVSGEFPATYGYGTLAVTPVTFPLPNNAEIVAGWSNLSAKRLDASSRWELAKQLVVEPRTFAKARLLHLYDLDSVDVQLASKLIEEALKAGRDVGRDSWQGVFLTEVEREDKAQKMYFGVAVEIVFAEPPTPDTKRAIARMIVDSLKGVAVAGLNRAAPKGIAEFGERTKIYLAAYDRLEGMESAESVLTYDQITPHIAKPK